MAPNPPFTVGENPTAAKLNSGVYVYDRATATVDVTNTVTETSLYTKAVGAGHMSADRMLRLTVLGDYLNNVGTIGITFRLKFGGTTFWSDTYTFPSVASALRKEWELQVRIANKAANSQYGAFTLVYVDPSDTTGPGSGGGRLATPSFVRNGGWSVLSTIDTALAQTLDVTAQWGSANANASWRKLHALLELV